MKKVFIDGRSGTTGLRIFERLEARDDIQLVTLSDELRRDISARKQAINTADIVFLCLPDDAARESVALCENKDTVIIDTSTAHRISPDWAYALPELSAEHRQKLSVSKRIAVPGCHASGFIALTYPLVANGVLPKQALLNCTSITGYSGGGKPMIADYQNEHKDEALCSPRLYGISQQHKHLPEMKLISGLVNDPVFCPIVAPYYSGMLVTIGLFSDMLTHNSTKQELINIYKTHYKFDIIRYVDVIDEGGFVASNSLSGKDGMEIAVFGNDERTVLAARFDNLGKGASGSAVQALNIALGVREDKGLVV